MPRQRQLYHYSCLLQFWWYKGEPNCLPGQQEVEDIMGCKTHLVVCSVPRGENLFELGGKKNMVGK